jgi:CheY-like chemotaxis protein
MPAASPFDRAILVVDDYPLVAATIKGLLRAEGFSDIDVAYGGVQALAKVAGRNYAVVVSDHKMPGMTGVELLHALRREGHHALRFVMVTGQKDADSAALRRSGVDALLAKPFSSETLRDTIAEMLADAMPDGDSLPAHSHAEP